MPDKKPTYRERNGSTRVGDALRWLAKQGKQVAPELLDIAGSLTGVDGLDKLADKIRGIEELTDFDKKMLIEQIELDKEEFKSISQRWDSDMTSDSWLSKNIRPLSLGFLTFSAVLLVFIDAGSINFEVSQEWISLLQILLLTIYSAYFGGRTIEKFKKISR